VPLSSSAPSARQPGENAPLASKVQIMMVPNDGKFFFANDLLHGALPAPSGAPAPQDKQ
jgi:hypothetical protein